jgi:hypothetical protein
LISTGFRTFSFVTIQEIGAYGRKMASTKCFDDVRGQIQAARVPVPAFSGTTSFAGVADNEPKVSVDPARSAGSVNNPKPASGPFSIGYSLGDSPSLMATGVAECDSG